MKPVHTLFKILILSLYLNLGLPSGLFSYVFRLAFPTFPICAIPSTRLAISFYSNLLRHHSYEK
jgi:hypothetical protein